MSEPLVGDVARQAVAPMRGYHYQILRSIYEWLDLAQGESLFLEGAEDIDRVSATEAQATQVKHTDTEVKLTLRSPAAIAAINNYWQLRSRNPHRAVRLVLLTTAEVGIEAGEPFGPGRAGTRVWEAAAAGALTDDSTAQAVQAVRRFLAEEARVAADVREFLSSASPAQIKAQLLDRIGWLTGQPSIGDVEAALLRKLTGICWARKVPASYARKVLDRLQSAAWSTAIDAMSRVLRIEDFYQLFDEVTTVSIPRASFDAITFAAMQASDTFAPGGGQPLVVLPGSVRVGLPPPVLGQQLRRPVLDASVQATLTRHGLAHLHGTTGTGKTTQAAVVAQRFANACVWVSCRDADVSDLRAALMEAGRQIDANAACRYVVLDDLDLPSHESALEDALPGLLFTLKRRGGALLMSAHRPLSQRLQMRLGVTSECELVMPPFTEVDVRDLLLEFGLQDPARAQLWSSLILMKTTGHPQLVAARIAALAEAQFPAPSASDLLQTPREVTDARADARIVISTELPAHQRELLYRLSLITTPFERRRALALAERAPEIANAGDSFDLLVGPWIERPSTTTYRVSPLLANAGQDANGPVWVRAAHAAIADAWLQFQEQSPWDIATILFAATLGENNRAIVRLAIGLQGETNEETWRAVAEANALFIHFYTGAGQRFPVRNPYETFCARGLQLQFAARARPEACEDILARIDEELPAGADDPRILVMRQMLLLQSLTLLGVETNPERLIRIIVEVEEGRPAFMTELGREVEEFHGDDVTARRVAGVDFAPAYGAALIQRIKTCEQLREVIPLIDAMRPATRAQCLSLFREEADMARQLVDSLFLVEHGSVQPRWRLLSDVLGALVEHAVRWNEIALAQGVASVRARVLHEQLQDNDAALAALADVPLAGPISYVVQDMHARILTTQGDLGRAVGLWRSALKQWEADADANPLGFAIAARNAAIAETRDANWPQAADYFERGAAAVSRAGDRRFEIGLLADAAHARLRAGQRPHAVRLAAQALHGLRSIPNRPDDVRDYYLHKVIGHTMTWMANVARWEARPLDEPSPGTCSNLDPADRIRSLPPTPIELSEGNLLVIAQASGERLSQFPQIVATLSQTPTLLARGRLIDAQLNENLDNGNVDPLPEQIAQWWLTIAELRRQDDDQSGSAKDIDASEAMLAESKPEFWMVYLCNGLLASAARELAVDGVLARWRGNLERLGAPVAVVNWIDEVARALTGGAVDRLRLLRHPDAHWTARIAIAAIILADRDSDPRMVINAHAMFVNLSGNAVMEPLKIRASAAVAAAWRLAAQRPVTLIDPRANVPQILDACDTQTEPLRMIARVFLAAAPAVEITISPDLMKRAMDAALPDSGPGTSSGGTVRDDEPSREAR